MITTLKNKIISHINRSKWAQTRLSIHGWKKWPAYNYHLLFPDRYANQIAFTDKVLTQYISQDDTAIELACGDGWYTNYIAKYLKQIDAYDISSTFIHLAKAKAKELNVHNVTYFCKDVRKIKKTKLHDLALCMGLFTYYTKDEEVTKTLNILKANTKDGAYLAVKDTLNIYETKALQTDSYSALYRQKDLFIQLFVQNGYEYVSEYQLSNEINEEGYVSMAFIFKKA